MQPTTTMPVVTTAPAVVSATPAHTTEWIERAAAQFVLDELLAARSIRQLVADGPYGHEFTEPLLSAGRDGSRFLIVPPGADASDVLAYVRTEAQQPIAA